jgi:N-dimethylarginine dimethylaminohydrolase
MSEPARWFGSHSMVAPLERVLMAEPGPELESADPRVWNYSAPIDICAARNESAALQGILRRAGVKVDLLPDARPGLADSVFTHDVSMITRRGAILMRMGKTLRRDETRLHEAYFRREGIPILGRIEPPGTVEAGDVVWLDEQTIAAGHGFRTNASGLEQLAVLLKSADISLERYDLPAYGGATGCLHLMSVLNMIDSDLALAVTELLPVRLLEQCERRGIRILSAPWSEFVASRSISANVLALAPRVLVAVQGYPQTLATLEGAGCRVERFAAQNLCVAAEGGPTCLTRPITRRR